MDYYVKKSMILQCIDKLAENTTPYNVHRVCYKPEEMPTRDVLTTMEKEAWACVKNGWNATQTSSNGERKNMAQTSNMS